MNRRQGERPPDSVLTMADGSFVTSCDPQRNQISEGPIDPAVSVVVLNWNGWQDTLECLDSLRRVKDVNLQIAVVDNGSTDDSCERIFAWAHAVSVAGPESGQGAGMTAENIATTPDGASVLLRVPGFVFLASRGNIGYAGGNNVGIRWALTNTDCEVIWILNNDCVVEPDSLSCMVKTMSDDARVQICGATIRSYRQSNRVLMTGGAHLSHVTFHSTPVVLSASECTQEVVQRRLSYISGACMLVRRSLFEKVGLLSERYFLFFEEPDLMERAGRDCRLAVSFDAIVYHKEGSTSGSVSATRHKSPLADYYSFRSRLLFVSTFYPHRVWLVWLELPVYALFRLAVGRPANAAGILRAGRDYLRLQRSGVLTRETS